MQQGRIHSHRVFSVEIPSLPLILQYQNIPSLCFLCINPPPVVLETKTHFLSIFNTLTNKIILIPD